MERRTYQVKFNTPAFLGNAERQGQWRTPPFKALLRQWWRVAYAAGRHGDRNLVAEMRRDEGLLFGVAADGRDGSRKSQIRLRLSRWDVGTLRSWQPLDKVSHPEVGFNVGSDLYLGFGPVTLPRNARHAALKANAAVQAGEKAMLSVAFPEEYASLIERSLWFVQHYGTLGGRSRNGWGSFSLTPVDRSARELDGGLDKRMTRNWSDALALDWPHAIGTEESKPLIWQTVAYEDWKALMKHMAEIKIGLRTQFNFTTGNNAAVPEDRHWLSYPVTKHSVRDWRNARLPNSLRFKVRREVSGKLRGVIVHVPCSPPAQFRPDRRAIETVWQRVHLFLDQPAQKLSRIPA